MFDKDLTPDHYPDLRAKDLEYALQALDTEIHRYEKILSTSTERRLGLQSDLDRFKGYREDVAVKLLAIDPTFRGA